MGVVVECLYPLTGFLLPAWMGFRCLVGRPGGPDALTLLKYWAVFAMFYLLESLLYCLLWWFPFYSYFRLAFVLWLHSGFTEGADTLYTSALVPFMKDNTELFELALQCFSFGMKQLAGKPAPQVPLPKKTE
eukprot:NODE_6464_length_532_cov_14.674074_g6299_i0.p1 GENE.NODE_6464_length_532_cov_14.674074_g6299_i0~~NODE_6464_length_532_cov_14.674074_g6299_i0.p1  ORF type:complete len:151 (+),score=40.42 NODE_6464_length_532_cov_14.674074_g6299_i0:60-455(+)